MQSRAVFPTFCHISEYGEHGYQSLHRMLAVSDRLHLWAPSSVLLLSSGCQVRPKDFIKYVESGRVVIHGREEWLLDPAWRSVRAKAWHGAQWHDAIDDEIRSLYYDDAMKPKGEKRVVVAPPERGSAWAADYLDQNPTEVDRWRRILTRRTVTSKLPPGTIQFVRREGEKTGGDIYSMARAVLRIAYNHGDAFRATGAEAPILLSSLDRKFLEVLGDAPNATADYTAALLPRDDTADPAKIALLAEQMLGVLQHLDLLSHHRANPGSIDKFLRGDGHRLLVAWFAELCQMVKYLDQQKIDALVLSHLQRDVDSATLVSPLRQLTKSKGKAVIEIAKLVGDALDAALSPSGLANLALGTYPVAGGVMKQLGWAPRTYTGQQWPFLYAFGGRATKRRLDHLRYALREIRKLQA